MGALYFGVFHLFGYEEGKYVLCLRGEGGSGNGKRAAGRARAVKRGHLMKGSGVVASSSVERKVSFWHFHEEVTQGGDCVHNPSTSI